MLSRRSRLPGSWVELLPREMLAITPITAHNTTNSTKFDCFERFITVPFLVLMSLFSTLVISTASQQLLLWTVRTKENRYEEEAGLHFCGTAIVFSISVSGELSFAVSGATAGADQGLPKRSWPKQRTLS